MHCIKQNLNKLLAGKSFLNHKIQNCAIKNVCLIILYDYFNNVLPFILVILRPEELVSWAEQDLNNKCCAEVSKNK